VIAPPAAVARMSAPLAVALALAGCVAGPTPGPLGDDWGGRGIALTIGPDAARVAYDCAAGTIDGPLATDAAGRFSAVGTHSPGLGGPARIDTPPPTYPARYTGSVRGDEMRLEVAVPARALHLGPFTLRRGAPPVLHSCL